VASGIKSIGQLPLIRENVERCFTRKRSNSGAHWRGSQRESWLVLSNGYYLFTTLESKYCRHQTGNSSRPYATHRGFHLMPSTSTIELTTNGRHRIQIVTEDWKMQFISPALYQSIASDAIRKWQSAYSSIYLFYCCCIMMIFLDYCNLITDLDLKTQSIILMLTRVIHIVANARNTRFAA
jgi:hypothetical protein